MKTCNRCEESKPVAAFALSRSCKDGRQARCRECAARDKRAQRAEYRRRNAAKTDAELYKGAKRCYACGRTLGRRMFYRNPSRSDGLANTCIECKQSMPRYPESSERRREAETRRRARKQRNGVIPYRRADIYERDGWVCQLCLAPVDKELQWPDPLCATIDHVIPIVKGGPDSPDNVQLSHARCNMSKGDRY